MSLLSPRAKIRLTYFLYAIAVAGAVTLLILGVLTLRRVETASARIEAQQKTLKDQAGRQEEANKVMQQILANQGLTIDEFNKSFDCFLTFLGTPNRTSLYISNYSTCTITDTRTGERRVLQAPIERPSADVSPSTGLQNGSQLTQEPEEEPRKSPQNPPKTPEPAVQPSALERLGKTLNDTLEKTPQTLDKILQLLTPKEDK